MRFTGSVAFGGAQLLEDPTLDAEVAAMVQRIARRLSLRRPREPGTERGSGRLASVPSRYRFDGIDLDRTIEMLAECPVHGQEDVIVREQMRSRRAVALVVDGSRSMRGGEGPCGRCDCGGRPGWGRAGRGAGLVAFWSDAALLKPLSAAVPANQLLDQLLPVPARRLAPPARRPRSGVGYGHLGHEAGGEPVGAQEPFQPRA